MSTLAHIHPALITSEVPVLYATTDGQTRRVAERLAVTFGALGFDSRAIDMASSDADYIDWTRVRGVVVGASLHAQHHQRAARAFVREHADDLDRQPSAFFSVSLAAVSKDPAEREAASRLAVAFPVRLQWHPDRVVCFGGRLAYTRYGLIKRFVMTRVARKEGASTDTSRDHEFTNWDDVTHLAEHVAHLIAAREPRKSVA